MTSLPYVSEIVHLGRHNAPVSYLIYFSGLWRVLWMGCSHTSPLLDLYSQPATIQLESKRGLELLMEFVGGYTREVTFAQVRL